ncbi:MAG: RNA polymerase subunit sigma [Verrucomicrobia bacterium]|nr:RNA polymerase subunit sigma [Verrucomicrobiota bacterium]
MSDARHILERARQGDPQAAEELLPLIYDELRRLAAHKMANEAAAQTLQPTALVHEAWLRLVGNDAAKFQSRAHFFAAAAEAMRRILIERARRRKVLAKGGFVEREELTDSKLVVKAPDDELLAVSEALERLEAEDAAAARLVKLRYFVGMSMPAAAEILEMPLRSAERSWTFARAFLRHELERG